MVARLIAVVAVCAIGAPACGDLRFDLVRVDNTAVSPGDDPQAPDFNDGSYFTFDLVVTTIDDDWTSALIYAVIDGPAVFFQHPLGGREPPDPDLFPDFPALEFDSYFAGAPGANIGFVDSETIIQPKYIQALWFDSVRPSEDNYAIARLTTQRAGTQRAPILSLVGRATHAGGGDLIWIGPFVLTIPVCPGDLNGDGLINWLDLVILLGSYGIDDGGDLDGDGDTDQSDLGILLANIHDNDGDGVPDACDRCPDFDDELDDDSDGVPDECDDCPDGPDSDGDGVCDWDDICHGGDDHADEDADGVPDFCDICPGFDDNLDRDGDGQPDDCDPCPDDNPDDPDGDGVCESDDLCPGFNDAVDSDGDGVPDACDTEQCELAKLLASDATRRDQFGYSACINGNAAVVGAPYQDELDYASGAAYVFRRESTAWIEEAKFLAPDDNPAHDRFGMSVSVSGDLIAVGAPWDEDAAWQAGSAYVFRREGTSWSPEAELFASDPAEDDSFGQRVAVQGDRIVVGTPGKDGVARDTGAVYVFRRDATEWVEEAQLVASNAERDDCFGRAVAIDGDLIVIGAHRLTAYVFQREGTAWIELAQLVPSDPSQDGGFGYAVSISGQRIAVGDYSDDHAGETSGSVYVFADEGTLWVQEAKLVAPDACAGDFFGFSVSVDGDLLVAGALLDDDGGFFSGSAYVFRRRNGEWIHTAKLVAADGEEYDRFAGAVSVADDLILVGARNDGNEGTSNPYGHGSAYVFSVIDEDCNENQTPDLCDIANGTSKDENGNDIPDECE